MKNKKKRILIRFLISLISASLFMCITQITVHLESITAQLICLCCVFVTIFVLLFFSKFKIKSIIKMVVSAFLAISVLCLSALGIRDYYAKSAEYAGEEPCPIIYRNKSVMIIIPHPDDDLNLMAGVIENYLDNGSTVNVVFTTNGDKFKIGKTRLREAENVWKAYDIPMDNLIFLGYGDSMENASGIRMYNADPTEVFTSYVGVCKTYALEEHSAYSANNLYTRENLKNDIKSVILEKKPDVIFSIDCDFHADHRTTSLLFEESMAEILRESSSYRPLVFKSFAYCTYYYGQKDFYQRNIYSTKVDCPNGYLEDVNVYSWSDRIRFPINSNVLSRYILKSDLYSKLSMYASQEYQKKAESVINGDKVFWERYTTSLIYDAYVSVSSGDKSKINDFKILDFNDVGNEKAMPYDGAWVPDENDSVKTVKIDFKTPTDISQIYLYDNPSLKDNIQSAEIIFDNGDVIETVPLKINGSATVIKCNQKEVKSFSIKLTGVEGKDAGLTEIEAYNDSCDRYDTGIIKLVNENDDFVYDYYLDNSGEETFSLYTYGAASDFDIRNYSFEYDNEKCTVKIDENKICVFCPKGEQMKLKIIDKVTGIYDVVYISNPRDIALRDLAQNIDKKIYHSFSPEKQIEYFNALKSEIYRVLFVH